MSSDTVSTTPAAAADRTWSLEPSGRLVHLRWAVAEVAITVDTPSVALDAAERALRLFANRALALLQDLELDDSAMGDACCAAELSISEARTALVQVYTLRVERAAALHTARRRLHRALVLVADARARAAGVRSVAASGFEAPELASLLALRQMFSAFRGGMISAGEQRARLSWALEVAAAELSVLAASPLLHDLPARSQQLLQELSARLLAWGLDEPEPLLGRALFREALAVPQLGSQLSAHPLLVEHDALALAELSAVLGNERATEALQGRVLGLLCRIRGLDPELDRLELNLIYGAPGVLGTLSLRVADLRLGFAGSRTSAPKSGRRRAAS